MKEIITIKVVEFMLRMTMNKSAAGAKKYYSEEYYNEGSSVQLDYYSDKNNSIGRWGGCAAEKLGLKEDISKDDFAKLCDNINPLNDKKLTGRNDKDRTVGYDLTFNASKSVSLAYAFANEEDKRQILAAFREAVSDTMKETETGMQARVRDKGKNENRETGNIAYGEFIHFTTRPIDGVPDPHLHAHCFVFNATYDGQDNKWKAGNFRQIKQDAPYYEAFFHSKLAEKLEATGYDIERAGKGIEISGIEKGTLDKFSRRTKEIEEHAKVNNITDDKAKSLIGARTREAKRSNVNGMQELAEWKNRLTDDEIKGFENLRSQAGSNDEGNDKNDIARNAVENSLKHHLERKSVASDKEILARAIRSCIGGATPEEVKNEFYANKEVISVKEDNRTLITTKEALNEEKQLIVNAFDAKGKFRPINENYQFKNDKLNDQQKKAVQYALNTTDGVTIISGRAGTGKTTLMTEVKQGINEAGKQIYSFAPSSEASKVQRTEGFENADTIASLILKADRHDEFKNQVIWIDEAGMVSNKDMNKVLAIAKEQNARVILSGDVRQHNSVERGDALRILQKDGGIAPVTVDKIQRQKNSDYRQAVKLLSEAKIEKGFKKLENIGAIHEISDSRERIRTVAEDYVNSSYKGGRQQNVLVIAPTHAEGEVVTNEIRNKLKENKRIKAEGREVTILKNLQFTEAEKQDSDNYSKGQVLSFHQNIKGVKAGSKLEVVDKDNDNIIGRDKAGKEYTVPLSQSKSFNLFESRKIEIAEGDKIRITANGRSIDGKHLFNGTGYDVMGFDKQGNIRLSNGSILSQDYGNLNFGYVITSQAAQGKTTDKIIISQSSSSFRASSMEQFYVSVSRGRQATAIYTDDKEVLMQAVSQSVQRASAMELVAKDEKMKAAFEHGRITMFNKIKDKARETIEKFTYSKNTNNGFSRADRNEPEKSR